LEGEGEGEGFLQDNLRMQAPKTPHLTPLHLTKGRGEKGWRVSFISQPDNQ